MMDPHPNRGERRSPDHNAAEGLSVPGVSSPELDRGVDVVIYYDGSATGTATDGLYEGAVYTPGEEIASFPIANVVTQVGNTYR
jgi:hypothetical protein